MLPSRVNSMLNLDLFRFEYLVTYLNHFMHNLEKWLNKSEGQVFWWPFHFSEIILCYSGFPGKLLFCHCQNIQDLVCSSTSSRVLMKDLNWEREKKENQKKIYFVKMNNFPTELLITVEEMRKSFIKHWWKSVYSLQTVLLFLFLLMKYFYQQSTLSAMLRVLRRDFQKQSLGNIL